MVRNEMMAVLAGLGIAGVGAAALVGGAIWQLGTHGDADAAMERAQASPAALPISPKPETDAWRTVAISGFLVGDEIHVLVEDAPLPNGRGPAFRVIRAIEIDDPAAADPRRVLVDLGVVPLGLKTPAMRPQVREPALFVKPAEITGRLVWPDEGSVLTSAPDHANNVWHARDVGAMAMALGTEPVLVVASETELHDGRDWPLAAGATPRAEWLHLVIAVCLFAMAAAWALIVATVVRRGLANARQLENMRSVEGCDLRGIDPC